MRRPKVPSDPILLLRYVLWNERGHFDFMPETRKAAAKALGAIATQDAIHALVEMVRDPNVEDSLNAICAEALGAALAKREEQGE